MTSAAKKRCPQCNKEFDPSEYFFHLQEETLILMKQMSKDMYEIKEAILLGTALMESDDVDASEDASDIMDGGTGNITDDDININDIPEDELKAALEYDTEKEEAEKTVQNAVQNAVQKIEKTKPELESECTDVSLGL